MKHSLLILLSLTLGASLSGMRMNRDTTKVIEEIRQELNRKMVERHSGKGRIETYHLNEGRPITIGEMIIGLGAIGLTFAGLHHINSKIAPMNKDRFVSEEIRNLCLKIFIPVTVIGTAVALIEHKKVAHGDNK